jgi:hypothetical protein
MERPFPVVVHTSLGLFKPAGRWLAQPSLLRFRAAASLGYHGRPFCHHHAFPATITPSANCPFHRDRPFRSRPPTMIALSITNISKRGFPLFFFIMNDSYNE